MTQKEDDFALLAQLAERLGRNLEDISLAVATDNQPAKVRAHDNSIEAILDTGYGDVRIQSPRAPGIKIRLVDHSSPYFASVPKDAIYEIKAYRNANQENIIESLNGDVERVYVGKDGIILDEPTRRKAAELYKKD